MEDIDLHYELRMKLFSKLENNFDENGFIHMDIVSDAIDEYMDEVIKEKHELNADIRNKLSPFKNIITMIRLLLNGPYNTDQMKNLFRKSLPSLNESIKYLTNIPFNKK